MPNERLKNYTRIHKLGANNLVEVYFTNKKSLSKIKSSDIAIDNGEGDDWNVIGSVHSTKFIKH